MSGTSPVDVLLVGGGMICHDQLLPALYQLQRIGLVRRLTVCARHGRTLERLATNPEIVAAFPGQTFTPYPDYRRVDPDREFPEAFAESLRRLAPGNLVFVALPDALHHEAVKTALAAGQHVLVVKPLVLRYREGAEIEAMARENGLFVGTEYHKRFDDRALLARMHYRAGRLGEFRLGQALLLEPNVYRDSNFQNWCTCENTDLFTYVGCHYVDLVAFITGLRPVEVSVYGIVDRYPNGNRGYLWTDGRVIWESGACLNVINAIGYPDGGPGGNTQGLRLFCHGRQDGCFLVHEDQYRGVAYCFDPATVSGKRYHEVNPDYLRLVDKGTGGLDAVGTATARSRPWFGPWAKSGRHAA